jgi:hypothetical protein
MHHGYSAPMPLDSTMSLTGTALRVSAYKLNEELFVIGITCDWDKVEEKSSQI